MVINVGRSFLKTKRRFTLDPSDSVFMIVVHLSLILILISAIYPLLHVLASSFSGGIAIVSGKVTIFPKDFTISAYKVIILAGRVPRAFLNSVIYTCVGTALNLIFTTTMAYPLAKKKLKFRAFYTTMVIITMFFSGGLIPTFLLALKLGMYNTLWALAVPAAIATWNLIIMRTFFQNIPEELEESAFMDGANDVVIFARIIVPLSKAAIAAISLFYAVGHWNSFMPGIIYFRSPEKYPLQVILNSLLKEARFSAEQGYIEPHEWRLIISRENLKFATLSISLVPMLIVYPFLQRYFVKGVMIGALKG